MARFLPSTLDLDLLEKSITTIPKIVMFHADESHGRNHPWQFPGTTPDTHLHSPPKLPLNVVNKPNMKSLGTSNLYCLYSPSWTNASPKNDGFQKFCSYSRVPFSSISMSNWVNKITWKPIENPQFLFPWHLEQHAFDGCDICLCRMKEV